jgi:replicative DNA helicase
MYSVSRSRIITGPPDGSRTNGNGPRIDRNDLGLPIIPPHSMDAERAVLGALLLDRDGFRKIGDLLRDAAFYSDAHKIIFRAMRNLHEQGTPLDMISVNEELRRMGKLTEIGGALALSNISMATPTAANIEHHARLVWEKGKRRELLIACAEILHHAGEEIDNIFEDLEMARSKVEGLLSSDEFPQRGQDEIRDRTQILTEIWEKIIDGDDGHIIPTGYAKLDARLGGLRPQEIIDIAGRPGSGKTALALSIGMNIAGLGPSGISEPKKVGIFELEMGRKQIWSRAIAQIARIDSSRFGRRGNRWTRDETRRITEAVEILSGSGLFIDTHPKYTLPLLRARMERLIVTRGFDLFVIDHAGKIKTPRGHSKHDEVGGIAQELKALAKDLNVPILPLWQLNRDCDKRSPPRPFLSDLRESGSIEEEADIVLMTYRPEYYKLQQFEDGDSAINAGDIQIEKNRDGEVDIVRMTYLKEFTRWESYLPSII